MMGRGIPRGSAGTCHTWSLYHVALAALLLAGCSCPALAATCSDVCIASTNPGNVTVDPSCLDDCQACTVSATGNCWNYFLPTWGSDGMMTDDATPVTSYNSYYLAYYCVPVCPLPWWSWVLVAIAGALLLTSMACCCYSCLQRRKRGKELELQAMEYQSQLAQTNPYPYTPQHY